MEEALDWLKEKVQGGVLKYWHHSVLADAVLSLCDSVGAKRDPY